MLQDITQPQPFLRVFPHPADVFNAPVERYARHLNPYVSIDLSCVNAAWSGWIHVVCPLEPGDGYVGDNTAPFHNAYLRPNIIVFRLDDTSRYDLMGDLRYFELESVDENSPEALQRESTELENDCFLRQQSYERRKARFLRHGTLLSARDEQRREADPGYDPARAIVSRLAGGVGYGNWCSEFGRVDDPADRRAQFAWLLEESRAMKTARTSSPSATTATVSSSLPRSTD